MAGNMHLIRKFGRFILLYHIVRASGTPKWAYILIILILISGDPPHAHINFSISTIYHTDMAIAILP